MPRYSFCKLMIKSILEKLASILMYPWRKAYRKRNGICVQENRHEIPNDIFLGLVSEKLAEGHTAIIWVKGYSMRPFIEYGRDRVKLAFPKELHVGDAVLAQDSPGHYVLHRIMDITGNNVTLQGDGNLRGFEHCLRENVCGVVTEYIRPNRVILASDKTLRRRIKIWRRLRPIRRYLLFIYKACI